MGSQPIGCLGFLFKLIGLGDSDDVSTADSTKTSNITEITEELPFRQCDNFLSPAELIFFHVLKPVIGNQFHLCAKVRISDLLTVDNRNKNMSYANRIDRRHVDFVLCDPKTMKPRLVVELDDSSHQRADRQERDKQNDLAFEAANLPILHVTCRRQYNPEELKNQIRAAMKPKSNSDEIVSATLPEAEVNDEASLKVGPPQCPKCRIAMIKRTGTRGKSKGKRFWGCPSYPKCKQIVAID